MSDQSPKPPAREPPRFDLSGKVALVTGATGILGTHFSRALAEHGARVALVDLDPTRCAEQASQIEAATGSPCLGLAADLTDPEQVTATVARVEDELDGLDILHNNAASKGSDLAAFLAPFEEYDLATWREVMDVNVDAAFLVAQAVGRRLIARGRGGSVIQTSSIYGIRAPDPRIYEGSEYLGHPITSPAVYAASKGAIGALTRYLAAWWAPHGIRVNTLVPGGISSGQNGAFHDRYAARVPLGRMGREEDLTGALVFLASDASSYVTGQEIVVDGGLSAW